MISRRLIFRVHAIKRMFERGISRMDVRRVLANGELVEDYPNDFPYPSRLILGWVRGRPLHVVSADSITAQETIIITVYEPNANQWESDYKRRK